MRILGACLLAACLVGCVDTDSDVDPASAAQSAVSDDVVPKAITPTRDALVLTPLAKSGNGINYHGGPVMTGGVNVYYIFYGNWSSGAKSILTTLAQNLGGSPYFNINTTYYNGSGTHVQNVVTYKGSTSDNYSHGKSLSDSGVLAVVSSAITSGKLPKDTKAVY